MSGREPRAVLLLLCLAAVGHLARAWLGRGEAPPGEILAAPAPGQAADPLRQRERSLAAARPLARGELVDLNSATAADIARLPRIGMSLAKRIVADRGSRGAFRGLDDLDRVPGVGPGVLALLGGRVRFGGGGASAPPRGDGANPRISGAYATTPKLPSGEPIDVNSAAEADLATLPGIGRVRARAIVAYRREAGPFAAVSDLVRVPGFSQSLVRRLAPLITAR